MQLLTIDPPLPYLIPNEPLCIALVGCGGTGSHIAQSLARLAAHTRDTGGPQIDLLFIDGDRVEAKNVGRQLFCAAEVGQNKAQTLATRFSAAFGLRIAAMPEMATLALFQRPSVVPPRPALGILIGAVDSAEGRRTLHTVLEAQGGWRLWLDCGNHESSGQVCVGSAANAKQLAGALALPGMCAQLPAPSLLYPELLKDAPVRPRADCAAAMEDNAQSLMVNQMMAAIAAEYLYAIVVRRRLTTFATVVDLASLTMRSTPITAKGIAQACGIPEAELQKTLKKKGKAAA